MKTIELTFITGEDEDEVPKTTKTTIFVDQIRNFHTRKYDQPGTRIVFHTGAALAVTETYESVREMLNSLNN